MVLESKNAKYICIIGGIIMIFFFISGFISSINATYFTGTVDKVYEIEEYRVTNNNRNGSESSDDYDYKAYIDVTANGHKYHVLINRETQYTFPNVGNQINLVKHADGKVYETQKVRNTLGQLVLLGFGLILLYGGLTGKVRPK